jgi:hypothetical protein
MPPGSLNDIVLCSELVRRGVSDHLMAPTSRSLRCCSLEELELRQTKAKKLPLSMRFGQAGLTWSKQQFWLRRSVSDSSPASACRSLVAARYSSFAIRCSQIRVMPQIPSFRRHRSSR